MWFSTFQAGIRKSTFTNSEKEVLQTVISKREETAQGVVEVTMNGSNGHLNTGNSHIFIKFQLLFMNSMHSMHSIHKSSYSMRSHSTLFWHFKALINYWLRFLLLLAFDLISHTEKMLRLFRTLVDFLRSQQNFRYNNKKCFRKFLDFPWSVQEKQFSFRYLNFCWDLRKSISYIEIIVSPNFVKLTAYSCTIIYRGI